MDGFSETTDDLAERDISVIAASADGRDEAAELADKTGLKFGYGVDKALAESLGGYWQEERGYAQPAEFALGPDNRVMHVSYSDGPLARTEARDLIKLIDFLRKKKSGD